MKKLIIFDLDGTLAESKSSIDAEMAKLLEALLVIVKVSVISGGAWSQFEKQVLAHLSGDKRLENLSLLHGVSDMAGSSDAARHFCYSAGVMVLSEKRPRDVLYRSAEPILTPTLPEERIGTIGNVVFPTGIDRRDDIGQPDRFDVYYGMADNRIGVARLDLPDCLPAGGVAAQPEGKV